MGDDGGMVREAWAVPPGWMAKDDTPGMVWRFDAAGNETVVDLETAVSWALAGRIVQEHSRVAYYSRQRRGETPVWRIHPIVQAVLYRHMDPAVLQPSLDGGWTMFGWSINVDPACPVTDGNGKPYAEIGWVIP